MYNSTPNNEVQTNSNVLKECSASDLNKPSESTINNKKDCNDNINSTNLNNNINDNEERIKQLTNVKHSLYSLLFPARTETNTGNTESKELPRPDEQTQSNSKPISQNENINKTSLKRKCPVGDSNVVVSKRSRNYSSIDGDSLKHVILCDDTNVLCRRKTKLASISASKKQQRRVPSKQHITSKLLKLSLKTATSSKPVVVSKSDSFIKLEVLV